MISHPRITEAQVIDALKEWGQFWPPPFALKDGGNLGQWARHFASGINTSIVARKHWSRARQVVYATCDKFPYPAQVIDAARKIDAENDVVIAERHQERKRDVVRLPPEAQKQIDEMIQQFKEEI